MENIIKTEELKALIEKKEDILIFDVRRKSDYQAESSMITGAEWRDPEEIEKWSATVPDDRQTVIYCVKGGSVSKSVSDFLQGKNIKVRYLEGGIQAWKAAGNKTVSE